MIKYLNYCLLFLLLAPLSIWAQAYSVLRFQLDYNKQPLVIGKSYYSTQKDSLKLSKFACYISNLKLVYSDGSMQSIDKKYILVHADSIQNLEIQFPTHKPVEASFLEFNIGVDSIPNTQGALAGDLDVQNGMYWAWQSGYINWKIEGTSTSCNTHKNQFAFHIGGYQANQNALRTLRLPFPKNAKNRLHIELTHFFDAVSLHEINTIQIPGEAAMKMADLFTKTFWLE
jgi:hypothetical protein